MRISDVLFAFPGILLAIGIVAILGPGLTNVTIAVAIFSVPAFARIVRSGTLAHKESTYVEAARAAMLSTGRDYMMAGEWHLTLFPGIAIFITVLSFNILGDGLHDALDPKLDRE